MSTVIVSAGVCKFQTRIRVKNTGTGTYELIIDSDCPAVRRIAGELKGGSVSDIRGDMIKTRIYETCSKHLKHTSCPVPSAIIKAIEVAFDLALPKDVHIEIKKGSP